ncbi:MAG: arginine decarboxylase [Bacteroidota bacterium]
MKNRYLDLIDQTFDFPQDGFRVEDGELLWWDIPLMDIIKQYGTPVKLSYLPKITDQIETARKLFNVGRAKARYEGEYKFCYCTKSSHFSFVLERVAESGAHIETSSAFDVNIIESLYEAGNLDKQRYIICNGYKKDQYLENIGRLVAQGFENVVVVLDNMNELRRLLPHIEDAPNKVKIGLRIASEEDPKFEFYTSRLGIRYRDIVPFYVDQIRELPNVELKMLHFFINVGISDSAYYWTELLKSIEVYCALKNICPELNSLNIGGGFPVKDSLAFEYDYEYMAEEIVAQIKENCQVRGVREPDLFTEFGSFTVAESGVNLYSILDQKQQNDREKWDMIDGSFMTTLPDIWAINKRFIMLAINHWEAPYEHIFLGGLTCDSDDYYNAEAHSNAIYLPRYKSDRTQYIGFFNTGAYQESLGGFGGIQHCLLPSPKHIVVDRDEQGELTTKLFSKEQSYKSMLKILGY